MKDMRFVGDERSVVFADFSHHEPNPYEHHGEFVVAANAPGLDIRRNVFLFDMDWRALVAYFQDLADSWRGWEGDKEWRTTEGDLAIHAVVNDFGHVNLWFSIKDGFPVTWEAAVGKFLYESGEPMTSLAAEVAAWVESGLAT